jgi:DUF438 domain-containing protein
MAKKARKGPKTLFDKVNEIDPYFVQEVYSATEVNLDARLATIAKEMTTSENARDADEDIKTHREQLKVMNETYTKPLTALKLKRKLIYKILEERGKVP